METDVQLPVRFGLHVTALATIVVAASDHGLVAIFLGAERERLRRDLTLALPHANLVEDEVGLSDILAKVGAFVDAPGTSLDLPLDVHGSPIELAVWQALRAIPAGQTRSYGQVARALPIPATAQEVGAACAANLLAIAIPCHRVVKADGSISGYRWGVPRKRRLLELEGAAL